ncbi:hypothetical protein HPB47_003813 [Ixodes persulcatus]|uniref:Uncharacterized protein n=1 Tax=Ixodes persulcatus TaxID=34615 RepID=A0AC60PIF8_IXOPE|nr:hypothetical protein HPB47_003813 [Ixodes persulcatus]
MLATFRSGCFQDAHKGHRTSATETRGDPYAVLTDGNSSKCSIIVHPEALSQEAPSSLVESTSYLQPARALQAQLSSPIPSTTPGIRALDEPTSEVANRRSSKPKPSEDDQSAGQVSSGDELNMPWYAENDDGLEDMSDDSGDLDSETSSDMEEGSDLCFQAASDVSLGAQVATTFRVLESLNIAMITERMYYYYQSGYLLLVVKQVYERRNSELLEQLRGKNLDLAGDGRCDSPAFCAKYCTYTFHEASTKKLIHIEQVQVPEVPSSNAMEKVAFLRGLAKLKDQGFTIASFMSDRHPGVECHMRTMESGTKHYFDTWHISKGVKKKLLAASRSGPCKDLEVWVQQVNNHLYHCAALGEGNGPLMVSMWMSLLNHVVNKHDGHDGPYHKCRHQPLSDRAWLAVAQEYRCKPAASQGHPASVLETQTYYVEAFNSLLLGFASKSRVVSPEGMEAR